MKYSYLTLGAAFWLIGCNQSAPASEKPAAAATPTATAEAPTVKPAAPDSAAAPADATATATPPAAPAPHDAETLKLAFAFKPAPDPDDPAHPRTSAHLLLQGAKPQDIDLGKFATRPDVVDAAKAKLAGFPSAMLMGFRSYQASSGTSSDLAVLKVDGRHLRIVQRRVEETATQPGEFKTAREIVLPANTTVVPAAPGRK